MTHTTRLLAAPAFLFLLIVAAVAAQAGELKATLDRSFYVNGTWVRAADLKPGDIVETADGKRVRITNITDVETERPVQAYCLEAGNDGNARILADGIIARGGDCDAEKNDTGETNVNAHSRLSLLGFLRELFGRWFGALRHPDTA